MLHNFFRHASFACRAPPIASPMSRNAAALPDLVKADRRIYVAASITAAILALCAALLSYNSLRHLAEESGIPYYLTFLFPVTLDGLILSGALMVLFYAGRGRRSWGGITLVFIGTVSSIAGNIAVSPPTMTARLVHAAAPITLFLGLEALSTLLRQGRNEMMGIIASGQEESAPGAVKEAPVPTTDRVEKPAEASTRNEPRVAFEPVVSAPSNTTHAAVSSMPTETKPVTKPKPVTEPKPAVKQSASRSRSSAGEPTLAERVISFLAQNPEASEAEIEAHIGVPEMEDANRKKYARKVMRREIAKMRGA